MEKNIYGPYVGHTSLLYEHNTMKMTKLIYKYENFKVL